MIANKEFTTLRDIQEMREKCRVNAKEPDCGSNPRSVTEKVSSSASPHGSFATETAKSAQAALIQSVKARNKSSRNTSPKNTSQTEAAAVIHLKSSS
jgi:hypothetical protein